MPFEKFEGFFLILLYYFIIKYIGLDPAPPFRSG
jgi:hypothetical protein